MAETTASSYTDKILQYYIGGLSDTVLSSIVKNRLSGTLSCNNHSNLEMKILGKYHQDAASANGIALNELTGTIP
jgi:hypothetical protein